MARLGSSALRAGWLNILLVALASCVVWANGLEDASDIDLPATTSLTAAEPSAPVAPPPQAVAAAPPPNLTPKPTPPSLTTDDAALPAASDASPTATGTPRSDMEAQVHKLLEQYYRGLIAPPKPVPVFARNAVVPAATPAWGSYRQRTVASGLPIWAWDVVPEAAVNRTAFLVSRMLDALHPDIRYRITSQAGAKVAIFNRDFQDALDIPEHSWLRQTAPQLNWVAGLGGTRQIPVTSISVQQVLELPGNGWPTESILLHEFGHHLHLAGLRDCELRGVLQAYANAKNSAAYASGTYIISNENEYMATAITAWFRGTARQDSQDGVVDRARMVVRDPTLSGVMNYMFHNRGRWEFTSECLACQSWPAPQDVPFNADARVPLIDLGLDTCLSANSSRRFMSPSTSLCTNADANCQYWALTGECSLHPSYMLRSCPQSCASCPLTSSSSLTSGSGKWPAICADTRAECYTWAIQGECRKNPGYMLKSCNASCTSCPKAKNTRPTPVKDAATVNRTQVVTFNVISNDYDADPGDVILPSLSSLPKQSKSRNPLVWSPDGSSVIYQAKTTFKGQDSFTYIVADQTGATASATVTVTVK